MCLFLCQYSRRHKHVNIYAPNIGAPKYRSKMLEDFKKDIDKNTLILGDFNTALSKMDRSSIQNINKDTAALNHALDQRDNIYKYMYKICIHIYMYIKFIYIYIHFHSKETKYTFFSNAHGTFSKIDHVIGHKTSLNKFKKIEIISSIFLDHKGLRLETNVKEKTQKHSKSWILNSMLLNNEWVKMRSRKK